MLGRLVVASACFTCVLAACATGSGPDRFFSVDPTEADGGRKGTTLPDDDDDRDEDRERDRLDDVSSTPPPDAGSEASVVSAATVLCGGYAYPESVIVPSVTCTGAASGCTGAHEFRVVGCYTSAPAPQPCPAGFKVATLGLIGQWAAAANVTRLISGRACIYANGVSNPGCGGDVVNYAYCWTKGAGCSSSCGGTCCEGYPNVVQACAEGTGYEAPVLCVK